MNALLVDDHALFREGFALLLATLKPDIQLAHASGWQNAADLAATQRFELVLLDWWLEDCDGQTMLEKLKAQAPDARIVILSGERSPDIVNRAIQLGACGFIPKGASKRELTDALQRVLSGQIYLPSMEPLPARRVPAPTVHQSFPELTNRQADVLRSALRGHSNKLIARELGISAATVATHLAAIYGIVGVKNRTEAVFLAATRGAVIG
ncbi:response regulator transcription factor [Piscinibacter sp. HJYY11]|uniref:response regulator n=1 Tax=Piscinibacter sp. HJYY11 TaxID=2801333 RepID=UPI00191E4B28|nr:response regulator transcription factor [Piscinibacter sp. HJYY11]MBL0726904.1 response regulator transcription factor [Piscinibacter sp. HJYY11]